MLREYKIQLYDEEYEHTKGTLTLTAENKEEAEGQMFRWENSHPGYKCGEWTSKVVDMPELGDVRI